MCGTIPDGLQVAAVAAGMETLARQFEEMKAQMDTHAGELKAQMGRIETKLERLGTQVSELKNDMAFVRSVALENNVMSKKVSHDWRLRLCDPLQYAHAHCASSEDATFGSDPLPSARGTLFRCDIDKSWNA